MKHRWIIVALALAAASLFAMSVTVGLWWQIGDIFTVGPSGGRRCFADGCHSTDLSWVAGDDMRWIRIGMATFAAGLLAAFTLAIFAATVASNRIPRMLAKFMLSAVSTAALAGIAFIALFPGVEGARISTGIPMFAGAIVLGVGAGVLALRSARGGDRLASSVGVVESKSGLAHVAKDEERDDRE